MPPINKRKLAEATQGLRPSLNVLFNTGYTSNAMVSGSAPEGKTGLTSKPFTVEELGSRLRSVFGAPES